MKKLFLLSIILMGINNVFAQVPQNKGYKLIYEENFDGDTLNTQDWYYREGRRTGGGYINGLNLKENVRIENGILYIDCRNELIDGVYENTGGGIISLKNFGYGYYECKSKPFMKGRGIHTSFWQAGGTTPRIFEIDSYEIDSKSYLGCNNLYVDLSSKDQRQPWVHRAQVPFTTDKDGWWIDGYEYTPDGIIFYDNGQEVAFSEWNELNAAQAVWLTALNGCGKVDVDSLPGYSAFDYFKFYAKDYPGVNILPNGNFEFNQDKFDPFNPLCWNLEGTESIVKVSSENAFRDDYKVCFNETKNAAFNTTIFQKLDYIMNGEYVFSAMIRGNGSKVTMISSTENNCLIKNKSFKSNDKWQKIQIPVIVKNNQVELKLNVTGDEEQWLDLDNVEFMKPSKEKNKSVADKAGNLFGDAVWAIGMKKPVVFSGDSKFYFFDRFVGLGNQITISMNVNADIMANMTPIARIPQKGKSGWAIQLTKDGGIIFRIGSKEEHVDVYAPNAYKPGYDSSIKCVFDNGTALIYVNNKLIKKQDNIIYDTNDQTAAGRLGTVGSAYEAVNAVIQDTGVKDIETTERMNFRGTLSNVQIFNKVVE